MDRFNLKNFVIWSRQILDENNEDYEENYKWFMRLVIIRFMEFGGYLDTKFEQCIVKKDNEGFKVWFRHQWNKVYNMFPEVFFELGNEDMENMPYDISKDEDVALCFLKSITKEVLSTEGMLDVGIIGWIHQYYISCDRSEVLSHCKENKINHEHIGCLTQLFTPWWIAKYLVQNSVGRICMENDLCSIKSDDMEYFTGFQCAVKKEPPIIKKLEDINIIDPCMGCGHIFLYAFDFLICQYINRGYSKEDAVKLIINKNLCGVDIDKKVYKICYFSLCIKAMQYDSTFLLGDARPRVYYINATNHEIEHFSKLLEQLYYDRGNHKNNTTLSKIRHIVHSFSNVNEKGSLIKIQYNNYEDIYELIDIYDKFPRGSSSFARDEFLNMVHVSEVLGNKYHAVITNPPYLSKRIYSKELSEFLKQNYNMGKFDLYAVFMQHAMENLCIDGGYIAMITIHSWMFLSSFEKLRKEIINNYFIVSMIHLGAAAFEDLNAYNALSSAFCIKKTTNYGKSVFIKLNDIPCSRDKAIYFKEKSRYYFLNQDVFKNIIGWPMVYWITKKEMDIFIKSKTLGDVGVIKQGMATSDNRRFLRYWYEVPFDKIGFNIKNLKEAENSGYKWFPYNKGGEYRKWYGNNELVVNWEHGGKEIKEYTDTLPQGSNVRMKSREFYFKEGLTWSLFGFENFGVRYKEEGFIFDVAGSSLFTEERYLFYILAFLCSNVAFKFLNYLAPTVNFQISDVRQLPFIYDEDKALEINLLCKECIKLCKEEWDDYETSWDFKSHPFMKYSECKDLEEISSKWDDYTTHRYEKLKQKEEQLNRIFIDIYALHHIVDYTVCNRDLSVRRAHRKCDVISFLSYSTGCILGRYDAVSKGFVAPKHGFSMIFKNIDHEYDLISYLKNFVASAFGEENLHNNMEFIARSLSDNKKEETPKEVIKKYYICQFFKEHMKTYKKHPVYWHFTEGKEKSLHIYMYMFSYDDHSFYYVAEYIEEVIKNHGKELSSEEMDELMDMKTRAEVLGKNPIKLYGNCNAYENYIKIKGAL